jgi:hypothetical protein
MKHRILIWAGVGFLVASAWVFYTFVTPPDVLGTALRNPTVETLLFTSCPISIAGRFLAFHFWWIPPINAGTYAVVGLIVETLRWKLHPASVPDHHTA